MTINDVLPLKAARRDTVVNLNVLGHRPLRYKRPNFDGVVYTDYAAPPYSARSSAITTSRLAKCDWVPFAVSNAWKRSKTHTL